MTAEKIHHGICPLCEATCGILVKTRGAEVLSIRGDEADPLSRGYVCPKVIGIADLHRDPDRLRKPLKRVGERFVEIEWAEAFDEIGERVQAIRDKHGADALGVYQGNPTVHNVGLLTFGQLLFRRLGTVNLFSATSTDQLPHMLAALKMFGNQVMLPVPDVDRTDLMVIIGANPVVSGGSLMTAPGFARRVKDLQARGGKLIVIDPRRTETADIADEHLFIRPATDALLLLAILNVGFDEGLIDLGRLGSVTDSLPALRNCVVEFTPEKVETVVSIDAKTIRSLAHRLAATAKAVVYGRIGICQQEFGGLSAWLINAVNLAFGHLDEVGGSMFTTPAVDLAKMAALVGANGSFDTLRSRVSDLPEFGGELPVACLAEEIETPGERQIRALITCAGNPALSAPNGARLDAALESLDLMVSIDIYLNETTRHADYILPPVSPLERDHYDLAFSAFMVRNQAKYARPVFPKPKGALDDWEICLELAKRLLPNGNRWLKPFGSVLAMVAKRLGPRGIIALGLATGPYRIRLSSLENHPSGMDLGALESRLPRLLGKKGRINAAPSIYLVDIDRLRDRMAEMPGDGLTLIGRRQLRNNNSWMHNCEHLVKGKSTCTLLMHPKDALARSLSDGQTAVLASRLGSIEVVVEVSDELMKGVVSLPHGWGHGGERTRQAVANATVGPSINQITDDQRVDRLSGNAAFSGLVVSVARLDASDREPFESANPSVKKSEIKSSETAVLFDRIGGDKLREVIADFYRRVFADVMIGFLFIGKDRHKLIRLEWEFVANMLGADVPYTGRPIRKAHASSPILGGHFERRLQILRDVIAEHGVDELVAERWIGHTLALREQVTSDRGSECDHDAIEFSEQPGGSS